MPFCTLGFFLAVLVASPLSKMHIILFCLGFSFASMWPNYMAVFPSSRGPRPGFQCFGVCPFLLAENVSNGLYQKPRLRGMKVVYAVARASVFFSSLLTIFTPFFSYFVLPLFCVGHFFGCSFCGASTQQSLPVACYFRPFLPVVSCPFTVPPPPSPLPPPHTASFLVAPHPHDPPCFFFSTRTYNGLRHLARGPPLLLPGV